MGWSKRMTTVATAAVPILGSQRLPFLGARQLVRGEFRMMFELSVVLKTLTCALRHGLVLIFLLFMPLSLGALAQIPETPTEATDLEKLIDKATADGVRVIIVDPKQIEKPKAAKETNFVSP